MLSSVLYTYIVVFYKWLSRRWAWRSPPQSRAGLEFFLSLSLSLFNPFIHSSFLHPLFSSSPPFISFHPLFLLVTSLIQTRVLSVVLSLYCLLLVDFYPGVFFLPVFLVGSRDAITQLVLFLPPLTTLFKFSPSQWLRNMISTMVATTVCLIC